MKILRTALLISFMTMSKIYAQTEASFQKETSVCFKVGTVINGTNRQLYKELNEGILEERYKPYDNSLYFMNVYASVGIEYHFLKPAAIQFNMGFHQTEQKYINSSLADPVPAYHISNNIFIEVLPAFIYRHTRVLAGANVTRSSPTIATANSLGQEFGVLQAQDKVKESYHLYSVVGVQQGFRIKTNELILSASYYGLLRHYDSGLQLTIGFLF